MEDDVILSKHPAGAIEAAIDAGVLEQFDLLFLDVIVPFDTQLWDWCRAVFNRRQFSIVDLSGLAFAGSASAAAARKLYALCADEIARRPNKPIDLFFRDQARSGNLRVAAIFPFVSTVRLDLIADTTISRRTDTAGDIVQLAMGLLRYSFFIGRDLAGYARPHVDYLSGIVATGPDGSEYDIVRQVLSFLT